MQKKDRPNFIKPRASVLMVNLGIRTTIWNVQVYSDPENEHRCSWRFPDPREGLNAIFSNDPKKWSKRDTLIWATQGYFGVTRSTEQRRKLGTKRCMTLVSFLTWQHKYRGSKHWKSSYDLSLIRSCKSWWHLLSNLMTVYLL